nr:uncharacterized protein LOC128690294 [Cherax quadricarinatus]
MMRTFCMHFPTDWDESLPLLLFSVRKTVQESAGYSLFELIFGHNVRGPFQVLKEGWMGEDVSSTLYNPSSRLQVARQLAKANLKAAQNKMKQRLMFVSLGLGQYFCKQGTMGCSLWLTTRPSTSRTRGPTLQMKKSPRSGTGLGAL